MKRLIILIAITFMITGALAVEQKVMLKCNSDSYVSQLSPDTNYGTARELVSQIKFTFNGTSRINNDSKIAYQHFALPSELIGKVRVLDARYYFFVVYYKGNSPYPAGDAIYSAGLYPVLASWDERTITYNNQPPASGPPFYQIANPKSSFYQSGTNVFEIEQYGLSLLQKYVDTGNSFGLAWYVDVAPTTSGILAVGDYMHALCIGAKESGKRMSYISMGYEVTTGNLVNGSNISPSTLGEVKALYH